MLERSTNVLHPDPAETRYLPLLRLQTWSRVAYFEEHQAPVPSLQVECALTSTGRSGGGGSYRRCTRRPTLTSSDPRNTWLEMPLRACQCISQIGMYNMHNYTSPKARTCLQGTTSCSIGPSDGTTSSSESIGFRQHFRSSITQASIFQFLQPARPTLRLPRSEAAAKRWYCA